MNKFEKSEKEQSKELFWLLDDLNRTFSEFSRKTSNKFTELYNLAFNIQQTIYEAHKPKPKRKPKK